MGKEQKVIVGAGIAAMAVVIAAAVVMIGGGGSDGEMSADAATTTTSTPTTTTAPSPVDVFDAAVELANDPTGELLTGDLPVPDEAFASYVAGDGAVLVEMHDIAAGLFVGSSCQQVGVAADKLMIPVDFREVAADVPNPDHAGLFVSEAAAFQEALTGCDSTPTPDTLEVFAYQWVIAERIFTEQTGIRD